MEPARRAPGTPGIMGKGRYHWGWGLGTQGGWCTGPLSEAEKRWSSKWSNPREHTPDESLESAGGTVAAQSKREPDGIYKAEAESSGGDRARESGRVKRLKHLPLRPRASRGLPKQAQ